MSEPAFMLEERLVAITRVQDDLRERINKLSGKSPDRKPLSDKLYHASLIARLLKSELGLTPAPTHARVGYVGGVKIISPVWDSDLGTT